MGHTPTGYSAHLQQGACAALIATVFNGQRAVCQLLLDWINPSKQPMELPMCKYSWRSYPSNDMCEADITFLCLAYKLRKIQGKQVSESAGHHQKYNAGDYYDRSCRYLGLLQLLVEYGSSLTAGAEGLFQAIVYPADTAAIQLLLQHGLDPNAALSDGNTLLHLLVTVGPVQAYLVQVRSRHHEAAVRTLLEAGASPRVRNDKQKTPLDECCSGFSSIKAMMMGALQSQGAVQQQGPSIAICCICMDRASNMVLVPCGHLCVCQECSQHAQRRCPICRTAVTQMVRTYPS